MEAGFHPIETALTKIFLLALLEEPSDAVAADRDLYGLPVQKRGLGVQNPTGFRALS